MYAKASIETLLVLLSGEHPVSPDDADWDEVLRLARRHGVIPLLHRRVKGRSGVPEWVALECREAYSNNAFRNFILYSEFSRVLGAFAAKGIPVLLLKGAYLAEAVYGDPGLRPMSDLDILVREKDLEQVTDLLKEIGYYMGEEEEEDHHHLPPFVKEGAVPVEVHWRLAPGHAPYRIDMEEVWSKSSRALVAEQEVLVLSAEHLLVYLCIHMAQHHFDCELRHFFDIRRTIENLGDQIRWERLKAICLEWKATKAAYVALALAKEMLDADVPADFLADLKPPDFSDQFTEAARSQLFSDWTVSSPVLTEMIKGCGIRDTLNLAIKSICLPKTAVAKLYKVSPGSPAVYWCYFRRVKDLIVEYGTLLWRLLTRGRQNYLLSDGEKAKALRSWLLSAGKGIS